MASPKPVVAAKPTSAKPAAAPAPTKTTTVSGGYSGIPATNTTTTGGYSGIPKTQTINLYGTPATNARPVTPNKNTSTNKQPGVGKTTGATNTFIPGYTPLNTGGGEAPAAPEKTVISRIPRLDSKGKIIGWDIVYSDGSTGFESNPAYGADEEVQGTTNINVLKSLLLAAGLPSSLVDTSVPFLQTLIKEGIDASSAITDCP